MKFIKSTRHRSSAEKRKSSNLFTVCESSASLQEHQHEVGNSSEENVKFSPLFFKMEEIECLNRLQAYCRSKKLRVTNQMIYRFAIFHGFNVNRASRAIAKKYDHPYMNFRLEDELAQYIRKTLTLFPVPGLKSAIGSDVIYWHPSRYQPSASSNRLLVENMCFLLNDMNQTIDQCRNGILLLVNMDGYKMKNFHRDTQMRLTKITEGQVIPASIVQILIVNPPPFFERIWKIVRPAFSALFSRRIKLIPCDKLGNYLMEGYEEYLPDDFDIDGRNALELVENWLDVKTKEEQLRTTTAPLAECPTERCEQPLSTSP
ncbi:unnamed protein product [Cylindrotheca closterium]|uniref:CRAL-TRIO domain-containing protein n=1 Tax=Cylindrotheca closterium TaxID=2856 RepID=A0AAD2PY13_9STRA|nr:unnamed protein product [Cylindrotheca closterium]